MELVDNVYLKFVNHLLKIKYKIKQKFNIIWFVLLTNTYFLQAHNSFNGGCKNYCKESIKPIIMNKELNNIINKNQIENYESCLSNSLCRGW